MNKDNILTPMNHREIDYMAQKLSGCNIPDAFSCDELLKWLDETGQRLFDEDLTMDYGTDCLRLYLMFESTPKENDAPFYESWQESALEGIYKFLSRYRRLVLTAVYWNELGNYTNINCENMTVAITDTRQKIEKYISRGNTLPNRHNIVSTLMELQKTLQKELNINEIINLMHDHAIKTAVPHGEATTVKNNENSHNNDKNKKITEKCKELIKINAQFAPNISKVLWNEINN